MTTLSEQNKALVLAAFDAAFNRRDPAAAERYCSPNYVQHTPCLAKPGQSR